MTRIGLLLTILMAALAGAAPAHAKLVYVKGVASPKVYVANDDGSGARRLVNGDFPAISPDGRWVMYYRGTATGGEVRMIRSTGGSTRRITRTTSFVGAEFSPDSTSVIAALRNRLVLHDIPSRSTVDLVRTATTGFSFSPDSSSIVYSKNDVFVRALDARRSTRLTFDKRSLHPVWTEQGIVFNKIVGDNDGFPRYELFEINDAGTRQVTNGAIPVRPLMNGLVPVARSADGSRLLAIESGESQPYTPAYAVDMTSGAARELVPSLAAAQPAGFSRDGTTVLMVTGTGDPTDPHDVFTVPWEGGARTVLVRGARAAGWNR